jgi:uncharacterized repeat protein (TIGR04138 family)
MTLHHPKIDELIRHDPRYTYEAYEFLFAALAHTQKMLERTPPADRVADQEYHVSGRELLEGVRDLALRDFGLMARTVFRMWGINRTDDIGELVFNLVEAGLMSKTSEDQRQDFHGVYDLDKALVQDYRIEVDTEAEGSP